MLSRFYLNIRVLLKHVMSFFDTLSDGDRAEIGYGIGGDPTAFGVLMHQHREAQALQRQIAQHGTGYQAASMAGTLPQATEPSTASPAVAGGGAAPDGYTRCEVLGMTELKQRSGWFSRAC